MHIQVCDHASMRWVVTHVAYKLVLLQLLVLLVMVIDLVVELRVFLDLNQLLVLAI